jgi:FMN phosphatase YigB (HAD superfamily)
MSEKHDVVFLFDVDNTLLDNDQMEHDLRLRLVDELGEEGSARYWAIFEELRGQEGYADYLGTLQRLRLERLTDPATLRMSSFLIDYPFPERLFPDVPAVLARCAALGPTVILSDGDAVFQPHKVQRAGLWKAVQGRVLIYLHKEEMLEEVRREYPAQHYIMVDDKLRILSAMKRVWGAALTTVMPLQGHYARDPRQLEGQPPPDLALDRIGDLVHHDIHALKAHGAALASAHAG